MPIQLQRDCLKDWSGTGISFRALPKTFRDAVRITRQLGIRFLWIDSMCIIQDSTKDWNHEAALMAEVYGNALCTLAALSSKNSSQGCKVTPNVQESLKSPYVELKADSHQSSRVRIFQSVPRTWIQEYTGQAGRDEDCPLRTRAWVLQEKELSNCTIYFAKNQLLWENKRRRATAQLPWEEIRSETPSEEPRMMYENPSRRLVGAGQHPWYQLVEDYTSRSLTIPTDKLIAFAGLAKAFGCNSRAQYLAGNWNTDMPAALLWHVSNRTATKPAYLAPSWSWASLMGGVTYDSIRIEPDHNSAQYEYPEDIYTGLRSLKIQARTTLEKLEIPYGNVSEGRLTLSGARCIGVRYDQRSVQYKDGGQPLFQQQATVGVFYQDIATTTAGVKDAFCVALQSESIRTLRWHQFRLKQDKAMRSTVMGLVIAKHPKKQEYVRIGLARWLDESLFDAVRPTTIELV